MQHTRTLEVTTNMLKRTFFQTEAEVVQRPCLTRKQIFPYLHGQELKAAASRLYTSLLGS